MWKISIQYTVLVFEPMTFTTWVTFHNHQTRSPCHFVNFLGNVNYCQKFAVLDTHPTYVRTYQPMYVPTNLCTYLPTYVRTYQPKNVPTYLCTYLRTYPCTYLPIYVGNYVS